MSDETVFELLYRVLDKHKQAVADYVLDGTLEDYEAYREMIGKHRMLRTIEMEVKALEQRFIHDD